MADRLHTTLLIPRRIAPDAIDDADHGAPPRILPRDACDESVTGGASFSRTCLNLGNTISGLGVLSLPYAVAQGGWLSLVLFALVGALCCYTGALIGRFMRAYASTVASLADIGHLAFGRAGQMAVRFLMYLDLYLVATSFLIMEGDSLGKIFPGAGVHLFGHWVAGKQLFMIATAIVVLPTTWLRDLSFLAYVSGAGLVASAVLTGSLVWAAAADAHGFHVRNGNVLKLAGLPTSLSLFFVCFCGHPVFPTVYSSMKKKENFTKVLLISSLLCSINYALTAVLGYLIYGNDVQAMITLNLPSGKIHTKIAILATLITPLAKYAIVVQPIMTGIEMKVSRLAGGQQSFLTRAAISTAVIASTAVVACSVPFFGYVMSFIGSFLNVTVVVLFPCASYLRIFVPGGGVHRAEFAVLVGILVAGVCLAAVGTYTSVHDIVHTFSHQG